MAKVLIAYDSKYGINADAVLHLASDLSAYVTGLSLNVLGGQWMG